MYYTKYRPQKFSEISKPNEIAEALATQVKNKKLGHAYLFVGPRGTGKTTTARILAKTLNCADIDKNGDPCDKCDFCLAVKTGNFLDLIEIDAASNRGIDDIRDLRDKIKLAPTSGKKKVYIIDEVHMLTAEAFNALLKTLEEPPAHATFILCTTEAHKVPETIKSRCQVFKFKRASVSQIVAKLEDIVLQEKLKTKVAKETLEKIAQASLGGFRDAETLLQQIVEGEVDVDSFVGLSSKQNFVDFVDSLIKKDTNSALRMVNKLFEEGIDLFTWSLELAKYLRDLLFISAGASEGLVDVSQEIFSEMERQAKILSAPQIVEYINAVIAAQNEIKNSNITQLPLEVAIVKICEGGGAGGYSGGGEPGIPGIPNEPVAISLHKVSQTPKKSKTPKTKKFDSSMKQIKSAWEDVIKVLVVYNHGLSALMKTTRPVDILEGRLVLEVSYKFHKERLETPKNRQIVESALEEILGESLPILCRVSEEPRPKSKYESGELTDFNVKVPADTVLGTKLIEVFDGALPL